MRNICLSILIISPLIFLSGCATGLSKRDYYQSLHNVKLGMSKSEFVQLFPDSVPRGAKKYPNGAVEVMEITFGEYSFFPSGKSANRNEWTGVESQAQWFYFYNDKLIQYGNPEDWPANPDVVIENRNG